MPACNLIKNQVLFNMYNNIVPYYLPSIEEIFI